MPFQNLTMPSPSPTALTTSPAVESAARVANFVRKVGKGRTLLKSLDRAEAAEAFGLLLRGAFAESQAGAFLQALRIKELSPDELDGMMDCLRSFQPMAVPQLPASIGASNGFTLNLASDTPRKGGYACLLAAALLAEKGFAVGVVRSEPVLSLNRASWDGTWSLLAGGHALASGGSGEAGDHKSGAEGTHDHEHECDDGCGVPHAAAALCVVETNDLVSPLRSLRKIRGELGFRSCLHTAEKLLNPWPQHPLVLGISHRHYTDRLCDYFARQGMTAKIILGNHGTPDLVLHKETEVWEVLPGGAVRTVYFHPEDLGLKPESSVYALSTFDGWRTEWAKPGHGTLGPVMDYHLAFFNYVAGISQGAAVPRLVSADTSTPQHAGGHA
jgi:hypothetical protein